MKQIWTSLRAAICRLLHRRLLNSDAHWESLVAAVRYFGQDRVTTAATRAKAVWRQAVQGRASSGSSFGFSDGEEYPVPPRGTWLLQMSREETTFRRWREAPPRYRLPQQMWHFVSLALSLRPIKRAHVPSAGTPLALSLALIGNSEQWEEMKFGSSQEVKTEQKDPVGINLQHPICDQFPVLPNMSWAKRGKKDNSSPIWDSFLSKATRICTPQKVLSQHGNQTSCNILQERIPTLLLVLDDRKNEITGNASRKPLACTALHPFWIENGQKEDFKT